MKYCGPRDYLRVAVFCLFWLLVTASVSASATPRFVFAANYFGGSISTFQVDASTGMLHHLRHTPTLKSPSALVLRPDGKFLYVTSQVLDKIAIYRIDKLNGALTEIKVSPVDSGVRSNFRLAMSPDGKLLYVPGRFTANLMVFRSAPKTGELTPLENNNFPTHGKRSRFVEVTPDGRFVYVSNANSNSLAAFRVDGEAESVEPVDGMPFEASAAPQATMVHPSGKFLYVANWQSAELTGYEIDQHTGALTLIADFDAPTGIYPFSGSIHPSGKYLYVANYATANVSGFHIDTNTGRLKPIDDMPVDAIGGEPVNVHLDKAGEFAYVPSYSDSSITIFEVDNKTGKLINPRQVMTRPGIRRLAILEGDSPVTISTQWMIATDVAGKTISSYAVSSTLGKLRLRHMLQLEDVPGEMALYSDAGLIFVSNEKAGRIDIFRMDKDGKISRLVDSSVALDGRLRGLRVNARGSHLYAVTQAPNQYLAYEIDVKNAVLKSVERIALPADSKPVHLLASPDERLTFVLDGIGNRIFGYRYLRADGPVMFELTRHGSPFAMGKGLSDFEIDPTGRYGLAVNSGDATVAVYAMPERWAPLKLVKGSPIQVGKRPVAIAMNPNGRDVYIVDSGTAQIHHFQLDADSGRLSVSSEPVSVGQKGDRTPQELTIEPSGRFAFLRYTAGEGVTRFEIDSATGRLTRPRQLLGKMPFSDLAFTAIIE